MMRPGLNNVDVEALSDEAKFYGLIKRQLHTQRRRRIVDRKLSELLRRSTQKVENIPRALSNKVQIHLFGHNRIDQSDQSYTTQSKVIERSYTTQPWTS